MKLFLVLFASSSNDFFNLLEAKDTKTFASEPFRFKSAK